MTQKVPTQNTLKLLDFLKSASKLKSMNIAYFVDAYEPQVNGVISVVNQLKNDLEKMGCNIYIVTPRRKNSKEKEGVLYLKARRSIVGKNEYITTDKVQKVIDFCVKNKIDILHAHNEFSTAKLAIKAAKKLHLPFVITFHTFLQHYVKVYVPFGFLIPTKIAQKIVDLYIKHIYKNAVVIYAVSGKVKEYLSSKNMLANKKIILIENAIDTSIILGNKNPQIMKAQSEKIKYTFKISDNDFVALYFGRLSHEKRLKELINIFAFNVDKSSKPIKLFILGDGPARADLEELVKSLKLENTIFFTGFVDRENLINYFNISNLFVSASISETYSMTVTESLCAGLPVLLREDACYFDRVENGKNGILAKNDDEFSKALLELVLNPEKLKTLKSNCSNDFGISSLDQAKKYLESYEDILKNWK